MLVLISSLIRSRYTNELVFSLDCIIKIQLIQWNIFVLGMPKSSLLARTSL